MESTRSTLVLLAKDLAAAREFYHGKLGAPIVREDGNAIVFRCGSGTHLDVTKSTSGIADQQTQAARRVRDIRAEVAELRDRGIKIEDYGTPGLNTEALADEAELDRKAARAALGIALEERECDRALLENGR